MVATAKGTAANAVPGSDDVVSQAWSHYPDLMKQAESYVRDFNRQARCWNADYFRVVGEPLTDAHSLLHDFLIDIVPCLPHRCIRGSVLGYLRVSFKYYAWNVEKEQGKRPRNTEYESLPAAHPERETVSALVREIQREAKRASVLEALDELSERERLAVTLKHVAGWKRQRIARELGVSVRQVARYLRSGESKLCRSLVALIR